MKIVESNTVQGTVREINIGEVTAAIRIQFGEDFFESAIPGAMLDDLGLKVGDRVTAMFKVTPVDVIK
jgi:molybdopterin-binding protein